MKELSEAHSRAINTLLVLTEQKLLEIELSFVKPSFHKPCHVLYENDLSLDKKEELRSIMDDIRKELKTWDEVYKVRRQSNSVYAEVFTTISFLWEMLCEYTDHRLNNYGYLDEETISDIDARVNRIVELSKNMQTVMTVQS